MRLKKQVIKKPKTVRVPINTSTVLKLKAESPLNYKFPKEMIDSYIFTKIEKNIKEIQRSVDSEAPGAQYSFRGVTKDYIYFAVVAKESKITEDEITDLKQKTRFEILTETMPSKSQPYIGLFRVSIM